MFQGQPGSSPLPGKSGNFMQDEKLGVFNQLESSQRKSGHTDQRGNTESSGQQEKARSSYNQKERKTTSNPLKGNVIEIEVIAHWFSLNHFPTL